MADFKTFFVGENQEIECTDFSDGKLLIKDEEGDTILISIDQLVELTEKLKGE